MQTRELHIAQAKHTGHFTRYINSIHQEAAAQRQVRALISLRDSCWDSGQREAGERFGRAAQMVEDGIERLKEEL